MIHNGLTLCSFVKLVDPASEYGPEATDRFRALCEGRKLVANIDHKEGSLLHLRLIDPADPSTTDDSLACINVELASEGLAILDRKGCSYLHAYPSLVNKIRSATTDAKKHRAGLFEFGDVEEEDD